MAALHRSNQCMHLLPSSFHMFVVFLNESFPKKFQYIYLNQNKKVNKIYYTDLTIYSHLRLHSHLDSHGPFHIFASFVHFKYVLTSLNVCTIYLTIKWSYY